LQIAFIAGRNSDHPRNRVVLKGLLQNGVTVVDCTQTGHLLSRYGLSSMRLRASLRKVEAIVVGYLGHPLVPIVRGMTRRAVLFDSFLSPYATLVEDRQFMSADSLSATTLKCLEKCAYTMADKTLVDSLANIDYLVNELGAPRRLLVRSFVGTDDSVFYPRASKAVHDRFIVHFHGSYQRLHGVRFIIEAAAILRESTDIEFRIIGRGMTFSRDAELASKLGLASVMFFQPVTYERLAELVSEADLCLGVFGVTRKAQRVIPAKVFDAMASKKPIVTGDTPAARELLEHLHDAYLCKCGDPMSLANAIVELKGDIQLRTGLAEHAYEKFRAQCSPRVIGREIVETLRFLCGKSD
jgi:glycosyltransferase involved in cell wall biosynthesis